MIILNSDKRIARKLEAAIAAMWGRGADAGKGRQEEQSAYYKCLQASYDKGFERAIEFFEIELRPIIAELYGNLDAAKEYERERRKSRR